MMEAPEKNPFAPPLADVDAGVLAPAATEYLIDADRGTRFGAALLDGLLYGAAALPGAFLTAFSGRETGLIFAYLGAFAVAIFNWVLITRTGQSIAKHWLRIRIVRMDGSPCGFVYGVVLRVWVLLAVGVALGLASGFGVLPQRAYNVLSFIDAVCIFAASRRCLHDYIAGTRVVVA
jgi:uncharacterized RDD family membrane protein YckC